VGLSKRQISGKKKVKHFFHREGPQDIPTGRKITATRFQNVNPESERSEQRAPQPSGFGRYHEVLHVCEMEAAENNEQEEQQRGNPGKTQLIEVGHTQAGERVPSPKGGRSNEKSRDGEKYLNSKLAVPHQRGDQLVGQPGGIRYLRQTKPHVDVIHQDEEDRETPERVYAIQSRRLAGQAHVCAHVLSCNGMVPPLSRSVDLSARLTGLPNITYRFHR
jgi:hypothetical protein